MFCGCGPPAFERPPAPVTVAAATSQNVPYYLDEVGRLKPTTGKVTEYPFPHSEITSREYFLDAQGRMWFGTPANNKVGYFYLAGATLRAGD